MDLPYKQYFALLLTKRILSQNPLLLLRKSLYPPESYPLAGLNLSTKAKLAADNYMDLGRVYQKNELKAGHTNLLNRCDLSMRVNAR